MLSNSVVHSVFRQYVEPEHVQVLQAACNNPAQALQGIVARRLVDIEDALVKERLNALALLAEAGLLEIKLALRLDKNGQFSPRISPEKAGIRSDSSGNHVAFSRSSNESADSQLKKIENIKVSRS